MEAQFGPNFNNQPQMPNNFDPAIKNQSKQLKTVIVLMVILLLVAIGIIAGLLKKDKIAKVSENNEVTPTLSEVQPTNEPSETVKNQESYQEDTGVVNQKKYVSPKLGISFLYLTKVKGSDETISVKEVGNKIYVYSNMLPSYTEGQFVEMFSKEQNETLAQAITSQLLKNLDPKKCYVEKANLQSKYPSGYEMAEISYPIVQNGDEPWWSNSEFCPKNYAKTNGVRYFLGDINHPKKFAYLDIGQYGIMADSQNTWQDTIKFID